MRRLPEEALLPRGVAESLLVLMIEGCGWLSTAGRPDGTRTYHYDGSMQLSAEAGAQLDSLIDLVAQRDAHPQV